MLLEVRVFSGLERFIPGGSFGQPIPVELEEGATARAVLEHLQIPEDQVFTILVNGRHAELEAVLPDGARVSLFPPVGGG